MAKQRGTALIVDDDAAVGQVLRDMIEAGGLAVTHIVENDEAAYALFERDQRWTVAFVDLNLGRGPTGVEVARRAAARADNVIVMTGLSRLPEALTGMGLLLKPFSVDQVHLLLESLGRP